MATTVVVSTAMRAFRALTEKMQRCAARIFGFWPGFGEGAGLKNPVTEPKRRQNPKRPLFAIPFGTSLQLLWKCSNVGRQMRKFQMNPLAVHFVLVLLLVL